MRYPAFAIDEPWQTPASIFNDTWGYRSWQKRGNSEEKIREKLLELVTVVSRGGNYILNIGPEGDGSVVPFEADVLRGMGDWLKTNGEAVFGTTGVPLRLPPSARLISATRHSAVTGCIFSSQRCRSMANCTCPESCREFTSVDPMCWAITRTEWLRSPVAARALLST